MDCWLPDGQVQSEAVMSEAPNMADMWNVPWRRSDWSGSFVSADGTATSDVTIDDVAILLAYGETSSKDWDGKTAGIAQLVDGRYISWESWWGPTGSGFNNDAYGGDADIIFAETEETATRAISESARELLAWFDGRQS